MMSDQNETGLELSDLTRSPGEDHPESGDASISARKATAALTLYTVSAAWNSFHTTLRLTNRLGSFIFSPIKIIYKSPPLRPVRNQFEKLVSRGETEVENWIQTGLDQEPRLRQATKSAFDPLVEAVANYLSTNPSFQKLVQEQVEQLAKESPNLPPIHLLVRVLADNYITYLNENPEQVKELVRSQGDIYIDQLEENPKQVQNLVQGQSANLVGEITSEVRERMVTGDSALEALVRRLFRRPPRSELPEPPTNVQARAAQVYLPGDFPRLRKIQPDE